VRDASFERSARSFGAAAELYDRARPPYPGEAIRWLLGEEPLDVVDLGAGTGIFSRAVAALGHRVTAVDHDPEMLARLGATSSGIRALEGSAETIPLPDAAADALVAAQAFHWFDTEQALAEIARVLRPGGILGPIWNLRDESAQWVARLTDIIPGGAGRSASVHARPGRDFGPLFPQVECAQFRHTTLQTTESLVEMIKSRSGYLIADAAERERVEREVRRLATGLPQPFELPYLTIAFRARRVSA
jgi:SAM-dependent methyltransferase